MQYALHEDAEAALKELQGKAKIGERALKLEYALKRGQRPQGVKAPQKRTSPSVGAHEKRERAARAGESASASKPSPKGKAIAPKEIARTLLVFGFPEKGDASVLRKKLKKFGPVELVEFPCTSVHIKALPFVADAATSDAQCVVLVRYKDAKKAKNAAKKLDGKSLVKSAQIRTRMMIDLTSKAKQRKFRLIVRNVAFSATELDVRKAFETHGPLLEISVPSNETRGGAAHKGFAFGSSRAEMMLPPPSRSMNGKIGKRAVAVDWAMRKGAYLVDEEKGGSDAGSKNEKAEEAEGKNDEEMADAKEDGGNDDEEEEDDSSDDESDGSSDSDGDEAKDERETPTKDLGGDVDQGLTVFVRYILFETVEETLYDTFKAFGPLKSVKLVREASTGRSKGCAFVQYYTKAGAQRALRKSEENAGGGITVEGRPLNVVVAVRRGDAARLKEDGKAKRAKQDKRHLYLAREGVLPADADIPSQDITKRGRAEREKKSKLASPLIYLPRGFYSKPFAQRRSCHFSERKQKDFCARREAWRGAEYCLQG